MTRSAETKPAVDPVCGMTVDPAAPRGGTHPHRGETFFFCSDRCRQKFAAEPEKFLAGKPPAAEAKPGRQYTCPMHPQIVRDGPGSCPICGMALEPLELIPGQTEANPELRAMTTRFWVSAALATMVLLLAMFRLLPAGRSSWVQLALTTPVVLWGGWPFFARGARSIVQRRLNMFTLIALGLGAAYGFSLFATLLPGALPPAFLEHGAAPVYFEAAAVITALVLLGQVLELRARSQTSSAIRALLDLSPKYARRLEADGRELDVPLEAVQPGDRLRVRPGEAVPVDGVVLEGESSLDESMVTGESMPVSRHPGSPVTGGTVNTTGALVMRAERVGADTLLAQIVRQVTQAQRSRAPIQKRADQISAWFVPAVIVVAILTALVWGAFGPEPRLAHALVNAVAVVIIACPCALGLATPISIMVATGRGAGAGVLVRDAEALERLARVDTLVLDKTGTLTEGKPRVVSVIPAEGISDEQLLALAAAVERGSEHPLAAAIVAAADQRGATIPPARDVRSLTGKGITGRVGTRAVSLGNEALLEELKSSAEPWRPRLQALREEGQTVMFVLEGARILGLVGVIDPIKPTTESALRDLRAEGLKVWMVTGDSRATAEAVARKLPLDGVEAQVLPEGKLKFIERLQRQRHVVAMAGDGINDAPALAQADVGIAMGTGTDVAIASAGVTLVKGELTGILRAVRLSHATIRNIRQNLFFAFLYNLLGVPIAAGVLYPVFGLLLSPMLAAAAMSFSSVSVISNALRLRQVRLDPVAEPARPPPPFRVAASAGSGSPG
ncbi:MAG: Copper-translocating P-type ATPase [Myxococcaceae bacterium]|nr:Copper-translocating P-type ATPase [Myxococcaceae bacterium]